jgi:hypothetical protein
MLNGSAIARASGIEQLEIHFARLVRLLGESERSAREYEQQQAPR